MKRLVASLSLVLLLAGCADAPPPKAPANNPLPVAIAVNQAGYLPGAPKVATVTVAKGGAGTPGPAFTVVKAGGGTVLSGRLTGPVEEPEASGGPAWLADFSALKTEGTYKVQIENGGESAPFRISAAVYGDVFRLTMRSYYLQRCGAALNDAATGLQHAACHLQPSVLEEDRTVKVETSGGWHDAGDYGKYIPSAAVTVGQLLMLSEVFPAAGTAALGDTALLGEVRYELEWMLKLQRSDGAVYHKVTTENFPGFILPEADTAPLLVYGVGTSSTALFAAAVARGARAYANVDPAFAAQLAAAARRAWAWLEQHPTLIRPPVGNTGAYLTATDQDAREWAVAELFALTGDSAYEGYLKAHERTSVAPPSWDNVADLALLTYANTPNADAAQKAKALAVLKAEADGRVQKAGKHPFGTVLGVSEYQWGSARKAMAVGLHLLLVNRLAPDPRYLSTALDQLNWVLGRNPLSQSFVTGIGAISPLHPHHRLAAATGKLAPGLLVGGPNGAGQDQFAPPGLGPRSYVDVQDSYSTNEPAIDYNAPLVFVAGWFTFGNDFR